MSLSCEKERFAYEVAAEISICMPKNISKAISHLLTYPVSMEDLLLCMYYIKKEVAILKKVESQKEFDNEAHGSEQA